MSCEFGGGGWKVKWDQKKKNYNSLLVIAGEGEQHLVLTSSPGVPADEMSRWHTVKLDYEKNHHAETDKGEKGEMLLFSNLLQERREMVLQTLLVLLLNFIVFFFFLPPGKYR